MRRHMAVEIKHTAIAIVCYLVATYVNDFVYGLMLMWDDPLYGSTPDSRIQWWLLWFAPILCPLRYFFFVPKGDPTVGRDAVSQRALFAPLGAMIATFLASYIACYGLTVLFKKK